MSLETAMVKANAQDAHYQAFMSELMSIAEFEAETLPQPVGEAAVARLHRLGGQYLNMNPYYVLLLEPGCSAEEVKAAYRRMSLQVHPDKHGGDPRAGAAFEIVRKAYEKVRHTQTTRSIPASPPSARAHSDPSSGAWQPRVREALHPSDAHAPLTAPSPLPASPPSALGGVLCPSPLRLPQMDDATKLDLCNRICAGAQKRVDEQIKSSRKAARKAGQDEAQPEDEPAVYRRVVRQFVCKMFVEFEQRRAQLEARDAADKKRKADEMALEKDEAALAAKEAAAWEKSRQKRVAGWRAWSSGSGRGMRRPPAVKAEGADERDTNFESRGVEWRRDWK
jgi:hypothetical protein